MTSQPVPGHQKLFSEQHAKPSKELELVLIAELTSRQEIKLRIKQNDDIPGAKVGWFFIRNSHAVALLTVFSSVVTYYMANY